MTEDFIPNPDFQKAVEEAAADGVNAMLLLVSTELKAELSKGGTGRIYRRGGGRRSGRNLREQGSHQASAAGSPPAADTGALRRSWTIGSSAPRPIVNEYTRGDRIGMTLGSPLAYARIDSGYGRVLPRPYIQPTIDRTADLFPEIMAAAIKRALGGQA